jgi:hypothetical protein
MQFSKGSDIVFDCQTNMEATERIGFDRGDDMEGEFPNRHGAGLGWPYFGLAPHAALAHHVRIVSWGRWPMFSRRPDAFVRLVGRALSVSRRVLIAESLIRSMVHSMQAWSLLKPRYNLIPIELSLPLSPCLPDHYQTCAILHPIHATLGSNDSISPLLQPTVRRPRATQTLT